MLLKMIQPCQNWGLVLSTSLLSLGNITVDLGGASDCCSVFTAEGGKKESRLDMLPLLYISHLCSALAVARLGSGFHKQSKVISPRSAVH